MLSRTFLQILRRYINCHEVCMIIHKINLLKTIYIKIIGIKPKLSGSDIQYTISIIKKRNALASRNKSSNYHILVVNLRAVQRNYGKLGVSRNFLWGARPMGEHARMLAAHCKYACARSSAALRWRAVCSDV